MLHPPNHRAAPALLLLCALLAALLPASNPAQAQDFPPVPIYAIQGNGPASPLQGEWVDAVGVVTGVGRDGFYLQDAQGDGDPATSDGIFVYTRRTPQVRTGQCILVRRAFVEEFYAKTELSRIKSTEPSTACSGGAPAPVPLPTARLGDDPAHRYEALEGMLVLVDDLVGRVQGPTKRFRNGDMEIGFVPQALAPHLPGGRVFQADPIQGAARMYVTNDLGVDLPHADWGDQIRLAARPGPDDALVGVLDYNFGKYQFIPLPGATLEVVPGDKPAGATAAAPATPAEVTVCTANMLGLGRGSDQYANDGSYAVALQRRARLIAETMGGCLIIGLQETGAPDDATNLADRLRADFGLPYAAVAIPGPGTDSREFPLTNSLLYRADRVQMTGATLRQGCSQYNYDVRYTAGACPQGQFQLFNRPPLVVDLQVQGDWAQAAGEPFLELTVITNHWKSKGGDESVNVVRRTDQARHVAALVQEILAADPAAHVMVLGDLNDFYASGPVEALRTGVTPPMEHLLAFLPPLERYTYIFDGASQVLDHVLVTPGLAPMVAAVTPLRVNADFAAPAQEANAPLVHVSDHDPLLVRLQPAGAAWLGLAVGYPGVRAQLLAQDGGTMASAISDAQGEIRLWNAAPGPARLVLEAPPHLQWAGAQSAQQEFAIVLNAGQNAGTDLLAPGEILLLQHDAVRLGTAAALTASLLAR